MSKTKLRFTATIVGNLQRESLLFIDDPVVRENVAVCLQYILFLVALDDEYELTGPVRNSLFKTTIVWSGALIELLLFYHLDALLERGELPANILPEIEDLKKKVKIYEVNPAEVIYAGVLTKSPKQLRRCDFVDLNRMNKKVGVLTGDLFKRVERVRTLRNTIHLGNFQPETHILTKREVNASLNTMSKITLRLWRMHQPKAARMPA